MSERNYKALRKVFGATENPVEYRTFKRSLRHSDADARAKTFALARKIVNKGVPIHHGSLPSGGQ